MICQQLVEGNVKRSEAVSRSGSSSESSTLRLSSDGISVHMRIPSQQAYLPNAMSTLREICHHLELNPESMFRVLVALEECLLNVVEHAYTDDSGLIDIQFAVDGQELVVVVEDFGVGLPTHLQQSPPENAVACVAAGNLTDEADAMRSRGRGLMIIRGLPSQTLLQSRSGHGTRATMIFNLPQVEVM